jgi:hypothetical protein
MTGRPATAEPREDLDEYARRLVADWPPLTEEQRTRLAGLLRPSTPAPAAASDQREAA